VDNCTAGYSSGTELVWSRKWVKDICYDAGAPPYGFNKTGSTIEDCKILNGGYNGVFQGFANPTVESCVTMEALTLDRTNADPLRQFINYLPYRRISQKDWAIEPETSRCAIHTAQGYCFQCVDVQLLDATMMSTYLVRSSPTDYECECTKLGYFLFIDPLVPGLIECRIIPIPHCKFRSQILKF
jgi:hypothetical protein